MIVLRLRTEWNGMESDNWGKKEQEQNDLAEGPCFKTEFQKIRNVPSPIFNHRVHINDENHFIVF